MVAPSRELMELTLADWLAELGDSDGVPGGGSALAAAVAAGAAVLVMAARVSGAVGHAAQAEKLRSRAASLVQRDAESYAAALDAREALASLEPQQRDFQLGRAYAAAAEPPLEIARTAADVAELAAELAGSGDPRVRADALAAAALASGASRGAVALVEVNLTATPDDERVAEARRCADRAERAVARAR